MLGFDFFEPNHIEFSDRFFKLEKIPLERFLLNNCISGSSKFGSSWVSFHAFRARNTLLAGCAQGIGDYDELAGGGRDDHLVRLPILPQPIIEDHQVAEILKLDPLHTMNWRSSSRILQA